MEDRHILKVYYKDNMTFKSYSLPEDITSAEVCTRFANKFLRISERVASHFCLHLIMSGKGNALLKSFHSFFSSQLIDKSIINIF